MGQIKLMTSLLFIAIFVIAIVSFAVQFADDNDTRVNLGDDEEYSSMKSGLDSEVEQFKQDANTSVTAIGKTTISTQTEATEGGTAFKVGPWTLLGMVRIAITSTYTKIFGPEFGVIFTAFLALLGIVMGFYIYKTLAGRNPD